MRTSASSGSVHTAEPGRPFWWRPFVVCAVLLAPLLVLYHSGRPTPAGALRSHQASLRRNSHIMAGPADSSLPPLLQRPRILLFGDSLTERSFDPEGGWGASLAHHYARKVDVINRGFGGYNSRQGRLIFRKVLAGTVGPGSTPPAVMTLWFGANDAALPDRSGQRQHVPVEEYASNLEAILREARAAGIAHLLLITPPPVHEPGRVAHQQMRMGTSDLVPPDRTLSASGAYAAAAQRVGNALGVPVLDMWTVLQQEPGWREVLLLPDGLHFSGQGQAVVGRLIREALTATHPSIRVEALANQLPWWDKWDSAAPASTWATFLENAEAEKDSKPADDKEKVSRSQHISEQKSKDG